MSLSNPRYLWKVYCLGTINDYETVISDTEPTVCPSDGVTPIDPALTEIVAEIFDGIVSVGYINIESALPDDKAIRLVNSDPNGGIFVDVGFGGIAINSTNAISLDAAAYSNFTTTVGNLDLEATNGGAGGLVNIDADTGINIGADQSMNATITPTVNIGTSANAKTVSVGNQTSTTTLNLMGGTGGVNVLTTGQHNITSTSGATDAIRLDAIGGIRTDSETVNIATNGTTAGAITLNAAFNDGGVSIISGTSGIALDSTFNNGGITISSGSNGIALNSGAGGIFLTAGASGIGINASGGGAVGIGHIQGGDIFFGSAAVARTIIMGNSTGATRVFNRFGTGGLIKHQEAATALADSDATLTLSQLLTAILSGTPTADRTLTLPTATDIVGGISSVEVGDSIDFTIINQTTAVDEASFIVASGTGGSIDGNEIVYHRTNGAGTSFSSGSGLFRLRITDIMTPTYVVYRIS